MNIETFKEALPYLIEAEIPALLVGHHGIGKTQGVSQYAKAEKALLKILNLGTQEVGDIIGLADFVKDKSGQNVATKFMMPDWAKEINEFCLANPDKKAILFLDEINRARRDVLQVIFPLLTEKRIHSTTFPSNFYVMGAMNPNTEDYIVTDISDKALMDRFCHIKLQPSKPEFFKYAKTQSFDTQLLQFLQDQPKMLAAELEAFELEVKPSRRSWFSVNKLIQLKTPANLMREMASGLVGSEAAIAMLKAMSESDKPITAKDVVDGYSKFKKRVEEYSDAKSGGRMDMLKFTCDSLIEFAQGRKTVLTKDESKNLADFLWAIPKDLAYNLCRELYMEDCTRPTIDEHSDLLTEIATKRKIKV